MDVGGRVSMGAQWSRNDKQNIFVFTINSIPILSSLQIGGMDFGNYIAHHPLLAAFLLYHLVGGVNGEGQVEGGGREHAQSKLSLTPSFLTPQARFCPH